MQSVSTTGQADPVVCVHQSAADIERCRRCGIQLLTAFIRSRDWVDRRVEEVTFIDDRTVRRRVSVELVVPAAPRLPGLAGNVVPIAMMRRKTLSNFSVWDEEGRPLKVLNMRENQRLTLSMISAWAAATLGVAGADLAPAVVEVLDDLVRGNQRLLLEAVAKLSGARGDDLARLYADRQFRVVAERVADNFLLLLLLPQPVGTRHLVKYCYDEKLTVAYKHPGYDPAAKTYSERSANVPRTDGSRILAVLGWSGTAIRFPVPAAEDCRSFHFGVVAPAGVLVGEATLLAGRPNHDPAGGGRAHRVELVAFDRDAAGAARADLHVVDVPLGSLSGAQVRLQVDPRGWLSTVAATCVGTFALLLYAVIQIWRGGAPTADDSRINLGAALLVTLVATATAFSVQPDAHKMAVRMLSAVRYLAAASATCGVVAASLFAFDTRGTSLKISLLVDDIVSGFPAVLVAVAWWQARCALAAAGTVPTSRWEQGRDVAAPEQWDIPDRTSAFDFLAKRYGFDQPAIRVASSEASRPDFQWTDGFEDAFQARLTAARLP